MITMNYRKKGLLIWYRRTILELLSPSVPLLCQIYFWSILRLSKLPEKIAIELLIFNMLYDIDIWKLDYIFRLRIHKLCKFRNIQSSRCFSNLTFISRKPLLSVSIMLNNAWTSSSWIWCFSIFWTWFQPATEIMLNKSWRKEKRKKPVFRYNFTMNSLKSMNLFPSVSKLLNIFSMFSSDMSSVMDLKKE